jgi:hypothetical protein
VSTVPVSFRVDETLLRQAREKAGSGEALAAQLRKAVAAIARGKTVPAGPEQLAMARLVVERALAELDGIE